MPVHRKDTAWHEILNVWTSTPLSLPTIATYRNNTKSPSNLSSQSIEAESRSISPQIRSQLLTNHSTETLSLNTRLNSSLTITDSPHRSSPSGFSLSKFLRGFKNHTFVRRERGRRNTRSILCDSMHPVRLTITLLNYSLNLLLGNSHIYSS